MSRIGSSPKAPPQRIPSHGWASSEAPASAEAVAAPSGAAFPGKGLRAGACSALYSDRPTGEPQSQVRSRRERIGRGGAAAVFMDMSNVASDQTLGVSPRAFNPKVGGIT